MNQSLLDSSSGFLTESREGMMNVAITKPIELEAGNLPAGVRSMADSTSNGSNQTSASVSANDFLTLLVTEMQNQDPTASVDPNEYINQLVNVNSLQQLISINQTLSGALSSSATKPGVQQANAGNSLAEAAPENIRLNQNRLGRKTSSHTAESMPAEFARREVLSNPVTLPFRQALVSGRSSAQGLSRLSS